MKKTLLIILFVLTSGIIIYNFQTQKEKTKIVNDELIVDNSKNEKEIYNVAYSASYAFNCQDLDKMYTNHEYIAIIRVDEVNEATTYREKTNQYIMPYTPGKATIIKALKGTFSSNKITFLRLGGTVSFAEYLKSLYPTERAKITRLMGEKDTSNLYVNNTSRDDITIEKGKTYLVYMNRSDDFHSSNEYSIEAFEYGLREIKHDQKTLDQITIKNNKTGSYEPLKKAISKKILPKFTSNTESI